MTNETDPGTVEVTQADREAAFALDNAMSGGFLKGYERAAYLNGERDDWHNVQHLARHRLAARSQSAATVQEVGQDVTKDVLASLVAALSILNRAHAEHKEPRKVVSSDAMFAQMLKDYEASVVRARAALTAEPAAHDWQAWAAEWHRCVETILTMAGLSPALGASEALQAMQAYITKAEAAEPAAKAGDAEIERRPEAEYWRGIRVVGYYYEVPTGLPEPSSQTMPKVDFHWSTSGQQQEAERLVKLSDVLALVAPPSPQPDMGSEASDRDPGAICICGDEDCGLWLYHGFSTLSPPASQSVEKMREALEAACNLKWCKEDRLDQAIKLLREALSALPHKEEATPATATERGRG